MGDSLYKFQVLNRPDYAFLFVEVPSDQTLMVEASAMATMSPNMQMKTKVKGGLGRFLTKESIFINEFTSKGGTGEIGIAPAAPGDLEHVRLKNQTIYLQGSSFVASTPGIKTESKWQGLIKGFFSGESLFLIRCSGDGDLWFNTYGAMIPIDVNGEYIVDTSYVVAFTEGLQYKVQPVSGMKSLLFSGEGLVSRFSGQGRLWIQTRQSPQFAWWVHPFRRIKERNN